ncbi:uncharacterized protein METZ01_LOCUS296426 [marine metagenome]|uniref:Uncharacterized protein n=1 Tax=marine metagenome TaxID=408172 RepID=A0A382M863_9ZZZZ
MEPGVSSGAGISCLAAPGRVISDGKYPV